MKRSGERSIPFPFGGVHGKVEPSNCEANPFGCTIFFVKEGDAERIRSVKRSGERSIPLPFGGVHGEAEPGNCEANPSGRTIFEVISV